MNNPIYTPTGKAREYAPLALNLYQGCAHGCRYCYAPAILRKSREEFRRSNAPRPGIIDALKKQLERQGAPAEIILLSFTSDPYQPRDDLDVTRQALEILDAYGCRVAILTKGGLRCCSEIGLIARRGWYLGATITTLDPALVRTWEPGAAPPKERLDMIRLASEGQKTRRRSVYTWVSVEPVLDFDDALDVIRVAHDAGASEIRVGKWNHHRQARTMDWPSFLDAVLAEFEARGIRGYIKNDLAACGSVPEKYRRRTFG